MFEIFIQFNIDLAHHSPFPRIVFFNLALQTKPVILSNVHLNLKNVQNHYLSHKDYFLIIKTKNEEIIIS